MHLPLIQPAEGFRQTAYCMTGAGEGRRKMIKKKKGKSQLYHAAQQHESEITSAPLQRNE